MDNFTFRNPTKIIFGRGAEKQVGAECAAYGGPVLLHYGGGSIKASGLYDVVTAALEQAGVKFYELPGVKPNPRLSLVREGIATCRNKGVKLILAVGGGSVIDSAKAIAAGVPYNGDVWDFFTFKGKPQVALPVGTVLTIPAAGSESSNGCVISNENGDFKRASDSNHIYPRFSALNPEAAFTLPNFQVACGSADILAHLMERYFTNTKHVELIDRLIESTMKTVINNVHTVLRNRSDYNSWAEIMWSGTLAHNNLLNTGRQGDWASHDIEHELSAVYDVAHGAGLAVIFPAWMKYVYKHDVDRFAQFAVRVFGVDHSFFTPERTALEGIARLTSLFTSMGLPITLEGLGITENRYEEMATKCTAYGPVGNFVPLDKDGVEAIFRLAGAN